jgi:hypothetical protein
MGSQPRLLFNEVDELSTDQDATKRALDEKSGVHLNSERGGAEMVAVDISGAIRQLNATRSSMTSLHFPSEPGVYAVYLSERASLPPFANPGGLLYVGKSESSLRARDRRTHFASGRSGQSTLRRTLGAILKDELGLKCIPRKDERPKDQDFRCYRFQDDGEERLTVRMRRNLEVGYVLAAPYGIPVKLLEDMIKEALKPPLNLDSAYRRANPLAASLMTLRKACVEGARTRALASGTIRSG